MPQKALSCVYAPIATYFRPSNVDQTGGGREAFSRDNSGCKSRFVASLLKIYTDIALSGFSQVGTQPFY